MNLQEANTALKVLLKHRSYELRVVEETCWRVSKLIVPYVEKLQQTYLDLRQGKYLSIITSNVNKITSSLVKQITAPGVGLTPWGLEIADPVKHGKSNDEKADLLLISVNAVSFHR